jgi:hypothetical protein
MIAETITSAPVAIQIGRNRAPTTAVATRLERSEVGVRALTIRPIRGGTTVKS